MKLYQYIFNKKGRDYCYPKRVIKWKNVSTFAVMRYKAEYF